MLKNLKSLFITSEEEQKPDNAPPQKSPANQGNAPQPQVSSSPKPVDNAILDRLLQALEDNNQAGFDYLEYRRALKSLSALSMDEATKFQSAFATASTMDVTLEKLIASIEFYKKVLLNEEDKFIKASKEQYSVNVEGRIKEKEKIIEVIKEKSVMIQKLTEEIRSHQAKQEELIKVIETADTRINETNSNFNQALQLLVSQMELDRDKLKQYIK